MTTMTRQFFGHAPYGAARMLAAVVVAVSAAAVSVHADAQPAPGPGPGHGPGMMHGGPGMHHGAGLGPGMFGGSPELAARRVDHMLDGLNATDAQRTQIKQIVQAAAADLKGQRDAGRALHQQLADLFTAPNPDANRAEALRQQMLAQHDQASKRMMQAMLDVSRVLTPEQKAKIAERMKQRQQRMEERRQRFERQQQPRQ